MQRIFSLWEESKRKYLNCLSGDEAELQMQQNWDDSTYFNHLLGSVPACNGELQELYIYFISIVYILFINIVYIFLDLSKITISKSNVVKAKQILLIWKLWHTVSSRKTDFVYTSVTGGKELLRRSDVNKLDWRVEHKS